MKLKVFIRIETPDDLYRYHRRIDIEDDSKDIDLRIMAAVEKVLKDESTPREHLLHTAR